MAFQLWLIGLEFRNIFLFNIYGGAPTPCEGYFSMFLLKRVLWNHISNNKSLWERCSLISRQKDLFIYLFICSFICLFIYLFIYLFHFYSVLVELVFFAYKNQTTSNSKKETNIQKVIATISTFSRKTAAILLNF